MSLTDLHLFIFKGYFFNHGLQFMKFQNDKLLKRATDWEKSGAIFHWQGEHGCFDATTGTYNSRSTHGFENNNGYVWTSPTTEESTGCVMFFLSD